MVWRGVWHYDEYIQRTHMAPIVALMHIENSSRITQRIWSNDITSNSRFADLFTTATFETKFIKQN